MCDANGATKDNWPATEGEGDEEGSTISSRRDQETPHPGHFTGGRVKEFRILQRGG